MDKSETDIENELREAYDAGVDKAENGANLQNCSFRHFSTRQKKKAWEFGVDGRTFDVVSILKASF